MKYEENRAALASSDFDWIFWTRGYGYGKNKTIKAKCVAAYDIDGSICAWDEIIIADNGFLVNFEI